MNSITCWRTRAGRSKSTDPAAGSPLRIRNLWIARIRPSWVFGWRLLNERPVCRANCLALTNWPTASKSTSNCWIVTTTVPFFGPLAIISSMSVATFHWVPSSARLVASITFFFSSLNGQFEAAYHLGQTTAHKTVAMGIQSSRKYSLRLLHSRFINCRNTNNNKNKNQFFVQIATTSSVIWKKNR